MPTLQKVFTFDITPEKFIDNCSDVELREAILLANERFNRTERTPEPVATLPEAPAPSEPVAAETSAGSAGIKTRAPGEKKQENWSPEDDAKLRELWPTMLGVEIAVQLNRNYKVVMAHATKLGLRKRSPRQRLPPAPEELAPTTELKKKKPERTTDCLGSEIRHSTI